MFARNDEELGWLLSTGNEFRNDIALDMCLDKCVTATFVKVYSIKQLPLS